jgi:hypothetical protein
MPKNTSVTSATSIPLPSLSSVLRLMLGGRFNEFLRVVDARHPAAASL